MKKLIMASITAVVVIVVLAGTLIPILDDATATHTTFKNTGLYYMESPIPEDETITYVFDGTDWTVNSESITFGYGYNVIVTDNMLIRTAGTTGQIRGDLSDTFTSGTFEVTADGINYTYTKTNESVSTGTWTYSVVYCAVLDDADYIMSDSTQDVNYLLPDSLIYGFGLTNVNGTYATFKIVGDLESVEVTTTTENITISNVQINKTAIEGYDDLYDFDSVTFTATDASDVSVAVTYNRVIIPSEVTAEKSVHFTDGENAIFNAIPVMIIIALLLGVVALVLRSRMD